MGYFSSRYDRDFISYRVWTMLGLVHSVSKSGRFPEEFLICAFRQMRSLLLSAPTVAVGK